MYFLVVLRVPGFDFFFFSPFLNEQFWLNPKLIGLKEKISMEFRLDVFLPKKAALPKKFIPERGWNYLLLFQ